MKNLKVKSILFSLLAMMAVAIFLTSCEQEYEIIGGDDSGILMTESYREDLSQKLYNDTDFQSLIKISQEVIDKLVSLKTEGNYHTFTTLLNADNFVNPYHMYIEAIENYENNIRLKYPEINTLNKADIESIYRLAVENPVNSRFGCIQACYSTLTWLNQQDSAAAQSQHNHCVANGGDPETCSDAAIAWLIQALDSNAQWYNDCKNDCPPGPIGPIGPRPVKVLEM